MWLSGLEIKKGSLYALASALQCFPQRFGKPWVLQEMWQMGIEAMDTSSGADKHIFAGWHALVALTFGICMPGTKLNYALVRYHTFMGSAQDVSLLLQ